MVRLIWVQGFGRLIVITFEHRKIWSSIGKNMESEMGTGLTHRAFVQSSTLPFANREVQVSHQNDR